MEQHWLVKDENPNLIIFALGWSCDYRAVSHLAVENYDMLCLYDYRHIESIDLNELSYKRKILVAWSFGVWVAAQIFTPDSFDRTIAVNGTPYPIDASRGIPQRVANLTLRALKSGGIEQFNLNTYGALCQSNPEVLPQRELAQQIAELENLYARIDSSPYAQFRWDCAVVGTADRIFPVANQFNCWGEKAIKTESPHYPFWDSQTLDIIFDR